MKVTFLAIHNLTFISLRAMITNLIYSMFFATKYFLRISAHLRRGRWAKVFTFSYSWRLQLRNMTRTARVWSQHQWPQWQCPRHLAWHRYCTAGDIDGKLKGVHLVEEDNWFTSQIVGALTITRLKAMLCWVLYEFIPSVPINDVLYVHVLHAVCNLFKLWMD